MWILYIYHLLHFYKWYNKRQLFYRFNLFDQMWRCLNFPLGVFYFIQLYATEKIVSYIKIQFIEWKNNIYVSIELYSKIKN